MHSELVSYKGHLVRVHYVNREELAPAFGMQRGESVFVRADLSPRVKRFVLAHELYHVADTAKWLGVYGREIRANIIPGLSDPVGLALVVLATFSSRERVRFYLSRIFKGY